MVEDPIIERKKYLPPRVEKLKLVSPDHLEEWFSRDKDKGLFEMVLVESILYSGMRMFANITENIRRAFELKTGVEVVLPLDTFKDGKVKKLFDSERVCDHHFDSIKIEDQGINLGHKEYCPYTDMGVKVELVRVDNGSYKLAPDHAFVFNLSSGVLHVKAGGKRHDIGSEVIYGPLKKGEKIHGSGDFLVIGVSYTDKAKVKDEKESGPAGFDVREWMEGVRASGVRGITHTGGENKIWLWGPKGGIKGQEPRVAVGMYYSPSVLLEPDEVFFHAFNSQVLLALPLVGDLRGVRPMINLGGMTSVLGKIGVWGGEGWKHGIQKIFPPGFLYLLIHTYPQSDVGLVYLKYPLTPWWRRLTLPIVEEMLKKWGYEVVN